MRAVLLSPDFIGQGMALGSLLLTEKPWKVPRFWVGGLRGCSNEA